MFTQVNHKPHSSRDIFSHFSLCSDEETASLVRAGLRVGPQMAGVVLVGKFRGLGFGFRA